MSLADMRLDMSPLDLVTNKAAMDPEWELYLTMATPLPEVVGSSAAYIARIALVMVRFPSGARGILAVVNERSCVVLITWQKL